MTDKLFDQGYHLHLAFKKKTRDAAEKQEIQNPYTILLKDSVYHPP